MDSDFFSQTMRLINQRGHFSRRQLWSIDFVGKRQHAAGNCSLDYVGAVLDFKADRLSNFIRPVCNTICVVGLAAEEKIAKSVRRIEMSAGRSDTLRCNQHSWPDDHVFIN